MEFSFKKNAWHARYINYIWGYSYYNFPNMCPYFWLTVFSIVFSLFIIPICILRDLTKWTINTLDTVIANYRFNKSEKYQESLGSFTDEELIQILAKYIEGFSYDSKSITVVNYLQDRYYSIYKDGQFFEVILNEEKRAEIKDPYFNKFFAKYDEYILQLREQELIKRKKRAKIRNLFTFDFKITPSQLSIFAKFMLKLGGWGLLAFVSYAILKIAALIYFDLLPTIDILAVLKGTLIFIGLITGAALLTFGLVELGRYVNFSSRVMNILGYAALPFIWLFEGIISLFKLIKMLYKDQCPGINWED